MPFKDHKYKYNQTVLKVFGFGENKSIKITTLKILRTSGVEDEEDKKRCKVNNSKLENNVSRAKNKIFEYAYCNPWEYFFTATLDKNKQNRTDLELFHKQLTQFIRDYNKKHNLTLKYILIPEKHADGKSWHMHGLLNGLPLSHLKQFVVGDKMGKSLADKVKGGDVVYNWFPYFNRFGFCDLEPIKNHEAVSKYITKYINKNLASSVTELNAHLYYCSRGLDIAKVIKKGTMSANIVPDYKNDYCSTTWFPYSEEVLQALVDSFL